jgi:hypothetical protein
VHWLALRGGGAGGQGVRRAPGRAHHLAGPQKRAKSDRADARLLRDLLEQVLLSMAFLLVGGYDTMTDLIGVGTLAYRATLTSSRPCAPAPR